MSSSPQDGTELARAADDLRLRDVRALRGRSRWHPAPVVIAEVHEGALGAYPPAEVEGFAERLRAALPSLEDADGGGGWAEVVERVARALHALAGPPVAFSRVVPGEGADPPLLVMEYAEEPLGIECAYEAAALIRAALRAEPVDVEATVGALHAAYMEAHPRPTMTVLIQAARRRGIPVRRDPDDEVVQLGLGARLRHLDGAMTDFTSVIATDITSDKHRTKRLLRRVGLPVPRGDTAATLEQALEIAEDIGYPVLLKPLDANDGRGISGRLDGPDAVAAAWLLAVAEHPTVVVEGFAPGRDHRVLVVGGRAVAVAERVPAHVVGDGARTVRALAEEANRNPARDPRSPAASLRPLPLDELTAAWLARSGLTLDSVPATGERVELRGTANISTGGTSIDRTDEIHPRNRTLSVLAADAVGLDVAGLDVLTPDIGVPFDENGAVIIEVNASPGIRMHTDPDEGEPRDAAGAIVEMLYPPGAPSTIPIAAVTGTNGKTTTTRLLAHLMGQGGARVGFTTTDGVYFQGDLLMEGDLTGPFAANVVLSNPRVDVAVLETARGGMLRSGLGFEACDVAVVLNVASDHLGLDRIHTVEQLAEVKGIIATAVRPGGHAVLNADQPLVLAMRERTPGEAVLFSVQGEANPRVAEHLAAGGSAALVDEEGGRESFVLRRGAERREVMPVADVPLTVGGAARFQLENVLAAVAAADALGMEMEAIRAGLRTFIPSSSSTPGRMNVLRTARGTVVVDYAHNPAAVRALADFARRMEGRRRIGVITMPGDRRDEDLRALGEAASGLDYVIVKEHPKYSRGRAPGEVARLIGEGLVAGGLAADCQEAVLNEAEAVERVLGMMEPGDVAVIAADDTAAVLAQIEPFVVRD
jgi:cyanophycin synthetase